MHFADFKHEAKSVDAYLYDASTVHIRLKTKKNITNNVKIIYGDPFYHAKDADGIHKWAPYGDGIPMIKRGSSETHDYFFIALKPRHLRMKYAFLIENRYLFGSREGIDLNKEKHLKYNLFNYFNFPYLNEEDLFTPPSWAKDRVWYSIFPERFNNGDPSINLKETKPWDSVKDFTNSDLFGGDLRGIIEKLDYIEDLGFNGLYLTPIFKAMSTHKYDTIDYYEIDEAFGTKEDLKELVEKAHQKGIKVMLDAVFNHVGLEHPFFLDVIKNGKNSEYYDCFYIIDESKPVLDIDMDLLKTKDYQTIRRAFKEVETLNYRTFAFTPFMPKVKTMHPKMKQYFLEVATYWIETFDIDGWRLDVSNEIPHAFWRDFRKAVKGVKKDAYIVGENWDNSMPWLQGDQYDAVMNYGILFPIWQFFGPHEDFKALNVETFKHQIDQALFEYPDHVNQAMYNLVDSHDTARMKTIAHGSTDKLKLAYAFLFSYPGSPSVYYGDELGMEGGHDPKNRQCMQWNVDQKHHPLKDFFKQLIHLKKTQKAFNSTWFHWMDTKSESVLMYQKEDLLFIMNNSSDSLTINLPRAFQKRSKELMRDQSIELKDTLTLTPYDLYIIQ